MNDAITERVAQVLAAISVAAMSNTRETANKNKVEKGSPFWSAAYEDVRAAVAREITLREQVTHLQMQLGYLAGEMMSKGDPRSLPEIVEHAARATAAPAKQS